MGYDNAALTREIGQALRNAHVIAYPPTGNSSVLVGASPSIEPFSARRPSPPAMTAPDPIAGPSDAPPRLAPADDACGPTCPARFDIDTPPMAHLRMQAAFQASSLDAVAKTVNLGTSSSVDDVSALIWEAFRLGLKGLTVFRAAGRARP
jgi:ribonucleoside-diphosphate reductase alpha chain